MLLNRGDGTSASSGGTSSPVLFQNQKLNHVHPGPSERQDDMVVQQNDISKQTQISLNIHFYYNQISLQYTYSAIYNYTYRYSVDSNPDSSLKMLNGYFRTCKAKKNCKMFTITALITKFAVEIVILVFYYMMFVLFFSKVNNVILKL